MLNTICEIDGDKFENFYKILSIFEKSEAIVITDSEIRQQFNTATITCNITDLVGESFNLHILNPKKYIKLLKSFVKKTTKTIQIQEDYEKYIITNGEINIYCPKQIDRIKLNNSVSNISGGITGVGVDIVIDKDVKKTIKQLSIDNEFVDLLVHKGQIKAISIPETAIYRFDQYVNEDINESNCDFRLRVYTILEIDGDSYTISLGVDSSNSYWVQSKIDTGFIAVSVLENAIRRDETENFLI